MRRSAYFGAALIGLLVVAAISVAAGSGRKPAKEPQGGASLRRISSSEVMDIIGRFPGLIPEWMAWAKNDTSYLVSVFEFSEVTTPLLSGVFPAARFYKGLSGSKPPYPYMMAIAGDRRYTMPDGFNQLLLHGGQEVTDKNMIALAKAFVVMALGNQRMYGNPMFGGPQGDELLAFPQVTFLGAKTTKLKTDRPTNDAVVLKARIGSQTEDWHFTVLQNQFEGAARVNKKGLIMDYNAIIVESLPGRGELAPTPNMIIETDSSGAYLEFDTQHPAGQHYYVIVKRNQDSTGNKVVFSLFDFPTNDTNVYVRVRDSIRHATRWLHKVQMNSGIGSDTWTPPLASTGICIATAGLADDTNPPATYQPITPAREITPEKVMEGTFPGADTELLRVHFCDQFFRDYPGSHEAHADTFARYVFSAETTSWRTQVNTWGLGTPPDPDHVHRVFINDTLHWYHARAIGDPFSDPGRDRRTGVPYDLWVRLPQYTNEDLLVRVAIAHEFYHGVEWGLDSCKWKPAEWDWFTEGQALFLPSVQVQGEEFLGSTRFYPKFANVYLTQKLNTSPTALSYSCDIFWRFMYEHFLRDSSFPQPKTALQLVSDCYAVNVGTSNSIGRGKAAIDSAISTYVPGYIPPPGWSNFGQVLDQFAVACYLNDDTSFHRWNPNPPGVYSRPGFTLGTDSAFRLGPNETDTIRVIDSIPHSFGIDLIPVALNGNVDTVLVSLTRPANRTLSARMVNVYPTGSLIRDSVEPAIGGSSDSSTSWQQYKLPTALKERICLVVTRQDTLDNSGCVDTVRFWVKRDVAVSELLPATDTVPRGTSYTQRAVVVNRGWMKESLYVRFQIDTVWSDSQLVTFSPGDTDTVVFSQWTATEGTHPTCCWVYIASDSTRDDDTLRGYLYVPGEEPQGSDDLWRLDFNGTWNQNMAQPCADSGMQPGGGGRIRHQWVCCWHQSRDTWPGHSTDYACLSWQESTAWTWDSMISPRINLAGCHSCSLFQSTYFTLDSRGTKQVLVSGDDGTSWDVVLSGAEVTRDTIDISPYADGSRDVRIAWVYDGSVQAQKAWCVDDVVIRGAPARSRDVAVNGIAYPCGAITGGTPITPRAYVVNHGKQSESLWVYMGVAGHWDQTCVWLAPHADTLVAFPSVLGLSSGDYTETCFVMLSPLVDECPANDTATMSFSVVSDTWMPKFPVYNGQGMRSGAAIVGVDSEKLFCAPGNGSPTNGRAFAKYLVAEDLWKARHTTQLKFVPGSALAYPGAGDTIYAIRGGTHSAFYGYSISQDRWFTLPSTPDTLGRGAGLACLGRDSVFALRGSRRSFYCYDVAEDTWHRRHDTPDNIGAGGRLVSVGGYLYAFRGGDHNDFYRYCPWTGTWDTLRSTPVPVETGAAMACDTVVGLIYAFFGGNRYDYDSAFYAYYTSQNQWLRRHRTPVATRSGGYLPEDHSISHGLHLLTMTSARRI